MCIKIILHLWYTTETTSDTEFFPSTIFDYLPSIYYNRYINVIFCAVRSLFSGTWRTARPNRQRPVAGRTSVRTSSHRCTPCVVVYYAQKNLETIIMFINITIIAIILWFFCFCAMVTYTIGLLLIVSIIQGIPLGQVRQPLCDV